MKKKHSRSSKPINCRDCTHYYITWDKNRPYGCRAMGFKCKKLPCWVVKESSGMACQTFKPKKSAKKKPTRRKQKLIRPKIKITIPDDD